MTDQQAQISIRRMVAADLDRVLGIASSLPNAPRLAAIGLRNRAEPGFNPPPCRSCCSHACG